MPGSFSYRSQSKGSECKNICVVGSICLQILSGKTKISTVGWAEMVAIFILGRVLFLVGGEKTGKAINNRNGLAKLY